MQKGVRPVDIQPSAQVSGCNSKDAQEAQGDLWEIRAWRETKEGPIQEVQERIRERDQKVEGWKQEFELEMCRFPGSVCQCTSINKVSGQLAWLDSGGKTSIETVDKAAVGDQPMPRDYGWQLEAETGPGAVRSGQDDGAWDEPLEEDRKDDEEKSFPGYTVVDHVHWSAIYWPGEQEEPIGSWLCPNYWWEGNWREQHWFTTFWRAKHSWDKWKSSIWKRRIQEILCAVGQRLPIK